MHWNYRLIKHDTDTDPSKHFIALHEVFYDEANRAESWTKDPITFVCDLDEDKMSIAEALAHAEADVKSYDILSERELLAACKAT